MYACTVKYDDLLARRCLISLDGTIGVVVCFPDVAVNKRGRFTETNNNRPADSGTGKEAISFEFFSTLHATRSGRPTFWFSDSNCRRLACSWPFFSPPPLLFSLSPFFFFFFFHEPSVHRAFVRAVQKRRFICTRVSGAHASERTCRVRRRSRQRMSAVLKSFPSGTDVI